MDRRWNLLISWMLTTVIAGCVEELGFTGLDAPDAAEVAGPDDVTAPDDSAMPEVGLEVSPNVDTAEGADSGCQGDACGSCPVAVIASNHDGEVLPGTLLTLTGEGSSSPFGDIVAWEWSVVAPMDSRSVFMPSNARVQTTFEANVIGTYLFRLKVWDAAGNASCVDAEHQVVVGPGEPAISIELTWSTPGDPDETDTGSGPEGRSAGSDLDLHFLHPDANGAWFDPRHDCHSSNMNPDWGGSGNIDDPLLDRDDGDGAGPEHVVLQQAEFGKVYRVGVHAFDDWDYGPSLATVRVYVQGQLRFEWADVELKRHDLWEVATISWPSQAVTAVKTTADGPVITTVVPPEL